MSRSHRRTLVTGLVLCAASAVAEAATWRSMAPAPVARAEGSLLVHEGGVYHFNGFDGSIDIEPSVERYDIASDRWATVALSDPSSDAPSAVTHNGLVVVDGEAWLIGGRIGDHPGRISDRVFVFDLERHRWRAGPSLPVPFAGGGAALVGRTIHVFGGTDARVECDVDTHLALDLDAPELGWRSLAGEAPFPMPRNHFATVVLDGLVYAIGGQRGHGNCATLERQRQQTALVHVYDPAAGRWSRRGDLPWAQSHAEPSTFVHAGAIWSVGGFVNGERVMSYAPATDTWTWQRDLELPERLLAPGARILGDSLYVFGGGAPDVRNPRAGTWATTLAGPPLDDDAGAGDGAGAGADDEGSRESVAVYRINLGGPALTDADGRVWSADTATDGRHATAPSRRWTTTVEPVAIDGDGAPAALFRTTRWSSERDRGLAWRFPVEPGEYEVRLHAAEMWSQAFADGKRRFDVRIEGADVDPGVDLYRRHGARRGATLRYRVTSDDALDVVLGHDVQNPAIQGLEIVALGTGPAADDGTGGQTGGTGGVATGGDAAGGAGGTAGGDVTPGGGVAGGDGASGSGVGDGDGIEPARLAIDEPDIDFGVAVSGRPVDRRIAIGNVGDRPLTIRSVDLGGDADLFALPLAAGDTLAPGESRVLTVRYLATVPGEHLSLAGIAHDGVEGVALLSLAGRTRRPDGLADGTLTSVWRVNVGGEAVLGGDGLIWQADDDATPDGWEHAASRRYTTRSSLTRDASVPSAADVAVFASERWSSDRRRGLAWSFPVRPGRHEVRLYFAEIYPGNFHDGARQFDVVLEGETVLEAFDVHAEVGARRGTLRRFVLDSDASLDIALEHVIENPALKGIEILACNAACE